MALTAFVNCDCGMLFLVYVRKAMIGQTGDDCQADVDAAKAMAEMFGATFVDGRENPVYTCPICGLEGDVRQPFAGS